MELEGFFSVGFFDVVGFGVGGYVEEGVVVFALFLVVVVGIVVVLWEEGAEYPGEEFELICFHRVVVLIILWCVL